MESKTDSVPTAQAPMRSSQRLPANRLCLSACSHKHSQASGNTSSSSEGIGLAHSYQRMGHLKSFEVRGNKTDLGLLGGSKILRENAGE